MAYQANNNPNDGLNRVANNLNQLVQQLRVNLAQPQNEIHLISYPDFYGGEQDPVTWMEEVEQVFEANRVPDARKIPIIVPYLKGSAATWWDDQMAQLQNFKPVFLEQFRTVTLEGKWFSQLTQRKKVIAGGNQFPEAAKAYIFLNGLRPELSTAVSPFMPNTLFEAYTRAKAFEHAHTQSSYGYNMNMNPVSSNAEQILQLTEAIKTMSEQLNQRKPRNYKNNNNNGNKSQIICFNPNQQELLQNMLALMNQINQNIGSNNTGNSNHTGNNTSSGNNNQNENETFVHIPEQDVHIFTAERRGSQSITVERKKSKRTTTRKRNVEDELPAIASLVTPYSIVSDLQNKPANITFGQLLKEVPTMRQELSKSLTKKRTIRRKSKMNVNIGAFQGSTALYCTATVYGTKIPLIIDSGSSGSVVTMQLLKKLKVTPERSSTIKMINVHGESKRALSEISNFPFNIGDVEIPVDVVVTDANSYQALVGNDWLSKGLLNQLFAFNEWDNSDQLLNSMENDSTSSLNEATTHVEDQLFNSMENQIISSLDETVIHIEDQLTSSMDSQTTSSKELLIDEDQIEYSFDLLENQLDQTIDEDKEPPECLYNLVENYLSMYFDEIENYEVHNVQLENISTIISGSYSSSLKGEEYSRTNHKGIPNEGSIILSTNPNTLPLRLDQRKENYNDNYQGSYTIGHQIPIYQYFYNELINDELDEFWIKAYLNRIFNAGIQTFEGWIFKGNIYNNEIILL
ncbi:7463_t:CDS:2, partial [Acaulospora morrowiae]